MNQIRFWINIIFFYRTSLWNGAVQAKNAWTSVDQGGEFLFILNMSGLISRQLSQYISVGSIFISCRSSTVLARVPSLAQKRAAILLREFCDTEDHLDRKFQIYKFTFFKIKVLLPPFSIIKCNILSSIFTWYFYVSLNLAFPLCKVLPYIFTWY